MNIRRAIASLIISVLLALLVYPSARADGLPEDVEYGVCFTHVDHRFPETLGGFAAPGSIVSNPPHWHLSELHLEDFTSLIGKCAHMNFYLVNDEDGVQQHHYAYLPKDEPYIEFVTMEDAMIPSDAGDNYFHREVSTRTGSCVNMGSTEAGKGNSNGDCSR